MKNISILLLMMLLVACDRKKHTDKDDLVTEWSHDGKDLIVVRKGIPIATFRNASNVCFIELTGTDGVADVTATYYEDEATGLAPSPLNILLGWRKDDGSMKIVAYDAKGEVVAPNDDTSKKQDVQQAVPPNGP
jgi:hypothetical protein